MLQRPWQLRLLLLLGVLSGTPAQTLAEDTSHVPARKRLSPLPTHWQHGAFMEVFVRAHQDRPASTGRVRPSMVRWPIWMNSYLKPIAAASA